MHTQSQHLSTPPIRLFNSKDKQYDTQSGNRVEMGFIGIFFWSS